MSNLLFPPTFAATRDSALQQLKEFIPYSGRYSRHRNHVVPGHTNVSRLSPAIRHGLLNIAECNDAVLTRYAPSTVEKFIQELYWRRYWKAWLSLRPQVWQHYLQELSELQNDPIATPLRDRAEECAAGNGPIAIMNHFARELTTTGYMHNHARMWFAAWWVHVERLPWQLGADFFFQHLLDADPASNTLSWRWVAGLQTPGKTYLPRRTNLEKYIHPDILCEHQTGLDLLEKPTALRPTNPSKPAITAPLLTSGAPQPHLRSGLWIHEEDLRPEDSPLSNLTFSSALLTHTTPAVDAPEHKETWLQEALTDTARRTESHFQLPTTHARTSSLPATLATWVCQEKLQQVIALRPDIGPLHDLLPSIQIALDSLKIPLVLLDRPEHLALRPLATGSFFQFWMKQQQL